MCSIIRKDNQYGWQLTVQAMFMQIRSEFGFMHYRAVIGVISEVWRCTFIWCKIYTYIFLLSFITRTADRSQHLSCCSVFSPYCFYTNYLSQKWHRWKKSDVKYLKDVVASQQGWEEFVVMFEVGPFKRLKSTVISTLLRI